MRPDPRRLLLARLWSLALLVPACGDGVNRAGTLDCDPLTDTGCPEGEHCRLGDGGARLCLAQADAPDAGCLVEACAPGETCAEVEGVLACRRLCALDGACPDGRACAYALTDSLGACVPACDPFAGAADCGAATCAPTPTVTYPVCQAVGPAREGEDCTENRCGSGLSCLSGDDGTRCRVLCPPGSDDRCPPPEICGGMVGGQDLGFCTSPPG